MSDSESSGSSASGGQDDQERFRKIRSTYAAAFGRFAPGRQAEPPADEVLVGREGERAYLVDLLISAGRQGAYLVTGRRGAGKTSFVRRSIEEYESSVFKRFLRADVGRGFWDRMAMVVVFTAILLAAFILSDLAALLVPHALLVTPGEGVPREHSAHALLLWLVLLPILVVLSWPVVYAMDVLRLALWNPSSKANSSSENERSQDRYEAFEGRRRTLYAGIWVLGIPAGLFFFFGPYLKSAGSFAHPTGFGLLFLAMSATYLAATLFDLIRNLVSPWIDSILSESKRSALVKTWRMALCPVAFSILLMAFLYWIGNALDDLEKIHSGFSGVDTLLRALLLGTFSFCLAVWLRGLEQLFLRLEDEKGQKGQKGPRRRSFLRSGVKGGAKRYMSSACILFTVGTSLSIWLSDGEYKFKLLGSFLGVASVFFGLGYLVIRIGASRKSRTESIRSRPPVRFLLILKAFLCIVLSAQLTLPILVGIADTAEYIAEEIRGTRAVPEISSAVPEISSALVLSPWSELEQHLKYSTELTGRLPAASTSESTSLLGRWTQLKENLKLSSSQPRDGPRFSPPFFSEGGVTSLLRLAMIMVCLLGLYFIDYEWIVRSQISWREDYFSDPAERPSYEDLPEFVSPGGGNQRDAVHRVYFQALAESSLPWQAYKIWLPVTTVRVNLGFDRLEHRRIIHAMLLGLREQYRKKFLSWSSPLANVGRIFLVIGALSLMTMFDDAWFQLPKHEEKVGGQPDSYPTVCEALKEMQGTKQGPSGVWSVICDFGDDHWLHFVYLDILSLPGSLEMTETASRSSGILKALLPYREEKLSFSLDTAMEEVDQASRNGDPQGVSTEETEGKAAADSEDEEVLLLSAGHNFCLYHVFLFLVSFVLVRRTAQMLPIFPYAQILRRIEDVLDSLSSTRRVADRKKVWRPARWLYDILVGGREREKETSPLDPRTVELAFLKILEDIQLGGLRFPGSARDDLSFPVPEITFIFDELDKLGSRPDPEGEEGAEAAEEVQALHAERVRSMALRSLLSDLKNILSSAEARFIFVGGRNLYDEWLADQTARQPLLTNIFEAVVYLPSLIADYGGRTREGEQRSLDQRIKEYLYLQEERSWQLYRYWIEKRWTPALGLGTRYRRGESFVQIRPTQHELDSFRLDLLEIDYPSSSDPDKMELRPEEAEELTRDFIKFLTYRSMGNPKKLKELLATFVRPAGRVFSRAEDGEKKARSAVADLRAKWPCRHVLQFGDIELFRIQLLTDIYTHISHGLERKLLRRDDKLVISVLFLTDFVFKFHRRAFSWSNLERVDELVHIHRAPDLRQTLEEIVDHSSERYLHRLLNGIYAFRFRSDVARELEYVSRQSPGEMAAFNFTLDESQSLKALYAAAVKGRDDATPGLVAGLGELYEFDQEFETARHYYTRAIRMLDTELEARVSAERRSYEIVDSRLPQSGAGKDEPDSELPSYVLQMILSRGAGASLARFFVTWAIRRLRLRLQIGMTFEQARNLELAETQYQAAGRLAKSILLAYLDETGKDHFHALDKAIGNPPDEPPPKPTGERKSENLLHVLKHLNILFQPAFAEAWVVEKLPGAIDTSCSVVEEYLWELRTTLPFVRSRAVELSKEATQVSGSNFALITSQLHNKAGDLYFLKGRSRFDYEDVQHSSPPSSTRTDRFLSGCFGLFDRISRDRSRPGDEASEGSNEEPLSEEGSAEAFARREAYLLRSHYHYAVSLHDLRRYLNHRIRSSKYKYNIAGSQWNENHKRYELEEEDHPTFEPKRWPDFIYRAAGGNLKDMADALFARVSLSRLFHRLQEEDTYQEDANQEDSPQEHRLVSSLGEFKDFIFEWLERSDQEVDQRRAIHLFLDLGYEKVIRLDTLAHWLGSWQFSGGEYFGFGTSKSEDRVIHFENPHDAEKRLIMALYLAGAGALCFQEAGYPEDSARELALTSEMAEQYLRWAILTKSISESVSSYPFSLRARLNSMSPSSDFLKDYPVPGFEAGDFQRIFWLHLAKLATECLEKAAEFFEDARFNPRKDSSSSKPQKDSGSKAKRDSKAADWRVGTTYPPELLTRIVSLLLLTTRQEVTSELKEPLLVLLVKCTGARPAWRLAGYDEDLFEDRTQSSVLEDLVKLDDDGTRKLGRAVLLESLRRHRYPMLNRLKGVKVLLVERYLDYPGDQYTSHLQEEKKQEQGKEKEEKKEQAYYQTLIDEFLEDAEIYQAPFHFTPLHIGTVCALRSLSERTGNGEEDRTDRYRRIARQELRRSREMYTMQRAYYESISNLYYLYDDLNDRYIHSQHALQMAGAEFAAFLEKVLESKETIDGR